MSISQEFKEIKKQILSVAEEIKKENVITKNEYEDLQKILEKEKITLAVVGQMKFGKSTFINAFIFGKPFLPSADTPMTASLTTIEYGENKEFIAETFSEEEWKRLKDLLQEYEKRGREDYAKSLKESIEKGEMLLKNINILGKKINVSSLDEIKEYVGVDGKFVSVTKMLTIKYPAEVLKESNFVDTPGFNDPILERERRALEFIKNADVVLVFLFGSRPFDSNDREVLTTKLSEVGIGKALIVLNKIDEVFAENPDKPPDEVLSELKNYVKENLHEAVDTQVTSEKIKDILKNAEIVPVSGLWALLGKMSEDDIRNDEYLEYYYENGIEDFDFINSKEDFLKYSNFNELEEKILKIVKNEKVNVIVNNIKSKIVGLIIEKQEKATQEMINLKRKLEYLNETEEQIKENLAKLNNFINNDYPNIFAKPDLKESFYNLIYTEINKIRELIHEKQKHVEEQIEILSNNDSFDNRKIVKEEVESIIYGALIDIKREINDDLRDIEQIKLQTQIKKTMENLFEKFMQSEIGKNSKLEWRDLLIIKEEILNTLNSEIKLKINTDESLKVEEGFALKGLLEMKFSVIKDSVKEIKLKAKQNLNSKIDDVLSQIDKIEDSLKNKIEPIIDKVDELFNEKVLRPIKLSLEEFLEEKEEYEKQSESMKNKLKELETLVSNLNKKKMEIEEKLSKIGS